MSNLQNSFLTSIQDSYQEYQISGARSTNKLKPPHQWIADFLSSQLDKQYEIYGIRADNNHINHAYEIKASGLYYDKKIDIGIKFKNKVISGIGFKFVTSNYQQNSMNYFENMLGETANLRRKEIGYGSLMVLPSKIEYLNKDGRCKKLEEITSHNLEKYLRLSQDRNFPHRPDAIGLIFVDINYNTHQVIGFTDIDKMNFTNDIKELLKTNVNLEKFLEIFVNLTIYKASTLCP